MEVKAYIKNLKISPKKLRFLIPEIKKMKPAEALDYLFYLPKKGAKILYKAIKSALNNAKTLKIPEDMLRFKTLLIEEGMKIKRYRPGSKGMVKPRRKRYSHIKIVLTEEEKKKELFPVKTGVKKVVEKKIEEENKKQTEKEIKKKVNIRKVKKVKKIK